MKKISLLFLLSCISVGYVYAMEWGASSSKELRDGLNLERELLRDTMRSLSSNAAKSNAELDAEIDALVREFQAVNTSAGTTKNSQIEEKQR